MAGPTTYADWVAMLDRFGKGDDTLLEQMSAGSFSLDAGTAQRFYTRVEEAYKKRKQCWLERFQRSFQISAVKTDEEFEAVLRDGKQNLFPLVRFVAVKAFPEDLAKTLREDLVAFVTEIRESMKAKASKSGTGKDKLILILSKFVLPELNPEQLSPSIRLNQKENSIPPTNGRKIIF